MTEHVEIREAIPDPGRTMEGLRDTGYDFNTAIADLVDNSIAANATKVDITLDMDFRGRLRLSIADNGIGMTRDDLILAMQYGAPKRPDPASLGKFGLGLKTASTAFCRELSVISRRSGDATATMATWDLDHVKEVKRWELQLTDTPDAEALKQLDTIAPGASGTVVLWRKIDRLLSAYQDPSGKPAKNALKRYKERLVDHLSAVYQRFLDPKDKRGRNVSISLDGKSIAPWDPFQEGLSEVVFNKEIEIEGTPATFKVRAFVLPRREEFPSDELAKAARLSSDNQGLYIYRQDRLIHAADWLGMFQKEPHGTLLRVEFSFDYRLDEAFHLDIKKSKIILDEGLWSHLKDQILPGPRYEANKRYREGQRKDIEKASKGAHDASNRTISTKESEVGGAEVNVSDPNTGEVVVKNAKGTFKLKLKVGSAEKPGEVSVAAVTDTDDGVLFEPGYIDMHKAVRINQNHPYYRKVYVPNFAQSVTMQGLDSLMWALCLAELSAGTDKTIESFREMRYEVSRILRKLVEELPEPVVGNEADVA